MTSAEGPAERLPVTALVPTRDRAASMRSLLGSLAAQDTVPARMVVVDASHGPETERVCGEPPRGLPTHIHYQRARRAGAAVQRIEGMQSVSDDFVLLLDDDIQFEAGCIRRLWSAIHSHASVGGANAMIVNQRYVAPGRLSRLLFTILDGKRRESWAGRCIGPALNLLPEDRDDLPEVVPVEWLNSTCTLYRREALPDPLFPPVFEGYSMFEDLALSLEVGREWALVNARTARIRHDGAPGDHKRDLRALARMELVNRHYVMRHVLRRTRVRHYLGLLLLQAFGVASSLRNPRSLPKLPSILAGKLDGACQLLSWTPTKR